MVLLPKNLQRRMKIVNRSTLNVGLSNLKKWKEEKNALRYDLSFQRHTGMWSLPAKSMLIWSILSDSCNLVQVEL